jgi:lipid II:glycine glycyltransferase (peptidoglycan interpeptide bridge formation enzyme)
MTITRLDIKRDITKYRNRLSKLQKRLEGLPIDGKIREGRKLKQTRQRLQSEIAHVEGLINLAQEALNED